jgi:hypothetical protein
MVCKKKKMSSFIHTKQTNTQNLSTHEKKWSVTTSTHQDIEDLTSSHTATTGGETITSTATGGETSRVQ